MKLNEVLEHQLPQNINASYCTCSYFFIVY